MNDVRTVRMGTVQQARPRAKERRKEGGGRWAGDRSVSVSDRGARVRGRRRGRAGRQKGKDVRALERRELALLDRAEPVVAEGTDERVLCETLTERHGLKGADAAAQAVRPPRARGARVPGDKERAGRVKKDRVSA